MKKYVFGLGSAQVTDNTQVLLFSCVLEVVRYIRFSRGLLIIMQVLSTAAAIGLVAHFLCGQAGPAAIVIGNGLALSSTAVVLQVAFQTNVAWLLSLCFFSCINPVMQC